MLTKPSVSPSAAEVSTALFGRNSTAVRSINLGSGCWLLHGKLLPSQSRPTEAEREDLWAHCPTEREQFIMYGRPVDVPRYVRLYSQKPLTVHVNGNDFEAVPIHKGPGFLSRWLATVPRCGYNAVVANWYPAGSDYIGWHGDKEKQIDAESAPVISLSLGAERRFEVRNEASGKTVFSELLGDGHVVVMGGPGFQRRFKHRVPKMIAQKDGTVGPRINLTVRKYKALADDRAAATPPPPPRPERPPPAPRKKRAMGRK